MILSPKECCWKETERTGRKVWCQYICTLQLRHCTMVSATSTGHAGLPELPVGLITKIV
jgi:hypothetical protein